MLTRHQYFTWLYVQMCRAYSTMRDDHTSSICRKWNLPGDREQRLRFIDQLPVHAFLPETFPYGVVPYLHLPSKERLAFLGIFMTNDSYDRHAMRLQGMANLRGVDMSIMFDHENMHVEMDRPWDISTDIVEVDLSPAMEQLLAAANYIS